MNNTSKRHDHEIRANRKVWNKKPLLQKVYRDFYRYISNFLGEELLNRTVEIGSGTGNIKEVLPDCLTTDLFPNSNIDQVENVYHLSFVDGSVDNFILFDVFHHLKYPGTALDEIARVVRPGGRVMIFEPAMSLLGCLVYGLFHHEPIGLKSDIEWLAPEGFKPADDLYFAAQSHCHRIFSKPGYRKKLIYWKIRTVKKLPALSYVGTGGFSGPQLYPQAAYPLITFLDKLLCPFPLLFATRMLVVLERVNIHRNND